MEVPHTGLGRRDSYTLSNSNNQHAGGIIKASKPKKKGIDWSTQITEVKVFTELEPEEGSVREGKVIYANNQISIYAY